MDFISPVNPRDGDTPGIYHDGDPSAGEEGSIPPAEVFENPQKEIMNVIISAGLEPDAEYLGQLYDAIIAIVNAAAPTLSADALHVPATFAGGVTTDGQVVYYDQSYSHYDLALGGIHTPSGIADVGNQRVYISGKSELLTGLTVGTYYLSDVTPGAITTTAPVSNPMEIGTAVSANVLNVDIEAAFSRLATTALHGLVALATDAVGLAGSDNTMAITAKVLKYVLDARTASTSATGLVKFVSNDSILSSTSSTLGVSVSALKNLTATTSRAGITRFATGGETLTGSATNIAVTPDGFNAARATDAVWGVTQYATSSETQSGSSTARAVTPAGLKSLTATTSRNGLAQLATTTEAAGSSSAVVVTPAGLNARTATTSRKGIVELCTDSEAAAGSDTTRYINAKQMKTVINAAIAAHEADTSITNTHNFIDQGP